MGAEPASYNDVVSWMPSKYKFIMYHDRISVNRTRNALDVDLAGDGVDGDENQLNIEVFSRLHESCVHRFRDDP